jgi:hypothetical protein
MNNRPVTRRVWPWLTVTAAITFVILATALTT